jgi:hypothetical protein
LTLASLLGEVVARLERSHVPYMITGSIASSYHGEPRTTHDVDIVIDPNDAQLAALVDELEAGGYYVDRQVARAAVADRTQFNAIASDATKVDFIVRHDRSFSRNEFSRRQRADLLGTAAFVATAEDLVIAKLEWAATSGSDRQIRDIEAILAIDDKLDVDYIDRWAATLGLADLWASLKSDPNVVDE